MENEKLTLRLDFKIEQAKENIARLTNEMNVATNKEDYYKFKRLQVEQRAFQKELKRLNKLKIEK